MKKIKESDRPDDDVYIMHAKRYAIKTFSGLERWYCTWWCVHIVYQKKIFKDP
jgi:hypothetical protein